MPSRGRAPSCNRPVHRPCCRAGTRLAFDNPCQTNTLPRVGRGKAQFFGDGDEVAQVAQFHVICLGDK